MEHSIYAAFEPTARQVFFFAQEEAAMLGENLVDIVHLLLGLLRNDECNGCKILRYLHVDREKLKAEILRRSTRGNSNLGKEMALTQRAKQIHTSAIHEAHSQGTEFISTGHILAALVKQSEGLAAEVLQAAGVTLTAVRTLLPQGGPLAVADLNEAINALSESDRERICSPNGVCTATLPLTVKSQLDVIARAVAPTAELGGDLTWLSIKPIHGYMPRRYEVTIPVSVKIETVSLEPEVYEELGLSEAA